MIPLRTKRTSVGGGLRILRRHRRCRGCSLWFLRHEVCQNTPFCFEDTFAHDMVSKMSKRQKVTEFWENARADDQQLCTVFKDKDRRVSQISKTSGELLKMTCGWGQVYEIKRSKEEFEGQSVGQMMWETQFYEWSRTTEEGLHGASGSASHVDEDADPHHLDTCRQGAQGTVATVCAFPFAISSTSTHPLPRTRCVSNLRERRNCQCAPLGLLSIMAMAVSCLRSRCPRPLTTRCARGLHWCRLAEI